MPWPPTWIPTTGRTRRTPFSWHPNPASGANTLAVTPDQRLLATEVGGEPTTALVTLWSLGHGGLRRLSAFEGGVAVAIAPDGRSW